MSDTGQGPDPEFRDRYNPDTDFPQINTYGTVGDEERSRLLGGPKLASRQSTQRLFQFLGILMCLVPLLIFMILLYTESKTDPYCAAWSALNAKLQRACSQDGTNCGNRGNILINRPDVIVSSLPAIVTIDLKLPDHFLPDFDGKNKLAIVFARAIHRANPKAIDRNYQVAVVSLSSLYQQLKSVQRPYGLIKEKFPVELFFTRYPVMVEVLLAFGAIEEWRGSAIGSQTSAFTLAASAKLIYRFNAATNSRVSLSVPLSRQTQRLAPLLNFAVKRAGWSRVKQSGDAHGNVSVVLSPFCNDNRYLGNCSRFCRGRDDQFGHYVCLSNGGKQCLSGYIKPQSSCRLTDTCWNQPCLNNGHCVNTASGPQCRCRYGFTGKYCGQAVDFCSKVQCLNGGTCVNFYGGYKCLCPSIFYGVHCEHPGDVCKQLTPCKNHATCQDLHDGYRCHCTPGFTGKDCDQDINECTASRVPFCKNGGTCVNTYGSAFCLCRPYTSGPRCGKTVPPPKDRVTCAARPCSNGGSCVALAYESFECRCAAGYTGLLCRFKTGAAAVRVPEIQLLALALLLLLRPAFDLLD